MRRKVIWSLLALGFCLTAPRTAAAYIGPGAGISVIGTAVAFIGALIFAIVGFVWYPLKRLVAMARTGRDRDRGQETASLS